MRIVPAALALAGLTVAAFACDAVDLAFYSVAATGGPGAAGVCMPGATAPSCYDGPPGDGGGGALQGRGTKEPARPTG